jgi:hypothetical protein
VATGFSTIVRFAALCLIWALSVPSATAQRLPSDFNGDGISDLVFISLQRTLVWEPIDVASGLPIESKAMGIVGDHIIMADWFRTGRPQIGVVRVERSTGEIIWRVRDDTGQTHQRKFGMAGDRVVAAADFNGNGAADAVIVRTEGRKLRWIISYDPYQGGTTQAEFLFGAAGEQIFYLNPDGKGMAFASLSDKGRSTRVRMFNPVTGKRRVLSDLPLVAKKRGKKLTVLPIDSPTGKQVIAMVRSSGGKTSVATLDPLKKKQPKKFRVHTVQANGDVAVGNYLSDAGHEVVVQGRNGASFIVNPFNAARRELSTPADAVLVDEFNINLLLTPPDDEDDDSPAPPPAPPSAPAPNVPPSGVAPEGGLRSVCSTVSPIAPGEMLVKSDPSSHIHRGDPRTTGYTVVCAALCPLFRNFVPFFYANGEFAGAVAQYGIFSGNGKPRLYGAVGDAKQHFTSEIAPRARSIGTGKLYLKMNGGNNPGSCKEFEPTGRNGSL